MKVVAAVAKEAQVLIPASQKDPQPFVMEASAVELRFAAP